MEALRPVGTMTESTTSDSKVVCFAPGATGARIAGKMFKNSRSLMNLVIAASASDALLIATHLKMWSVSAEWNVRSARSRTGGSLPLHWGEEACENAMNWRKCRRQTCK